MIKETFLKYVLVFIAGTFLNFSAIAETTQTNLLNFI